jgi:hypothetical protein
MRCLFVHLTQTQALALVGGQFCGGIGPQIPTVNLYLPVSELWLTLFYKSGHAFVLIIGGKQRVK